MAAFPVNRAVLEHKPLLSPARRLCHQSPLCRGEGFSGQLGEGRGGLEEAATEKGTSGRKAELESLNCISFTAEESGRSLFDSLRLSRVLEGRVPESLRKVRGFCRKGDGEGGRTEGSCFSQDSHLENDPAPPTTTQHTPLIWISPFNQCTLV